MTDLSQYKTLIDARLQELGTRMQEIEAELDHEKTRDLNDQAIDLEDDEVLEGVGLAAQRETQLLQAALNRIAQGTYGVCAKCGDPISEERLKAVLYAPLCRNCASSAMR